MKILIDGQMVNEEFGNLKEFDQFWQALNHDLYRKNRIIRCVEINNVPYFVDYEVNIAQYFDKIKEVRISTISEHTLIQDTLEEIQVYIGKIQKSLQLISQGFYGGMDQDQDWQRFLQLSSGLEWLYQALYSVNNLMKKNQIFAISENKLQQILTQFENIIKNMMEYMENNDYVAVGDILEYEFQPFLEELNIGLNEIQVR